MTTIADLTPDDKNFNKHTQKGMGLLDKSLRNYGAGRSILIDKNNRIIAGNGIVEAAGQIGLEDVQIVESDGKKIIAVKRTDVDLDSDQGREMALADNATSAANLEWDFDAIREAGLTADDVAIWDLEMPETIEQEKEQARLDLAEVFTVPPTSVIDARRGEWQKRKKQWNTLIGDSGESREHLLGSSDFMSAINNGVSILDAALAETLCRWFIPNNIDYKPNVFDCFAGDSVFGFVSAYLGNHFSGTELREEQAKLNNERVNAENLDAEYFCEDGRNIDKILEPESQDLFFSCPPYFDLEHYSDDPRDASNQGSYEEFLKLLDDAFSASIACLKKNRFAVVIMSAVRDKKGFYYDIPSDITRIFEKNGCHLYNQIILVDTGATLALRVGNAMKNRKVGRQHQEVLVYYNGEESLLDEDINEWKTIARNHQNIAVYYKPGDNNQKIQDDFKDLRKEFKDEK